MTAAATTCPTKGTFSEDGFTLVELLVAILLLMIGFLAVITVFWTSAASGTFTRHIPRGPRAEMLERAKPSKHSHT